MRLSSLHRTDVYSGLFFLATGAAVATVSTQYAVGSAMRMGPGYFPLVLAGLLAVLGAAVLLRALLRNDGSRAEGAALRPLVLVGGGVLAFGHLLTGVGLAGATLALVGLSGAAHNEARVRELLTLGVGLALFGVGVFVWGLGLPLPVLPV